MTTANLFYRNLAITFFTGNMFWAGVFLIFK